MLEAMQVQHTKWQGLSAYRLMGSGYEALVVPAFGANCISLIHVASASQLLRVPESLQQLQSSCNTYGLPILFPPNRTANGSFHFDGRLYAFPINEPARKNHLHGFLSSTLFEHRQDGVFEYKATSENPYLDFPHTFTLRRVYTLDQNGLHCSIEVHNQSKHTMPVGVGIHAAWNSVGECRLQMQPIHRWLVDPVRLLSTGETMAEEPLLAALRNGTLNPNAQPLSMQTELVPNTEIVLHKQKGAWHCKPDASMRFLMLWNGGGTNGFVCPEPQSQIADAANVPLPYDVTGLQALAPDETVSFHVSYYYTEEE